MDEEADIFNGRVIAINIGVAEFGAALERQGVEVVYVDWKPPAGGDQEMIDLLDLLL